LTAQSIKFTVHGDPATAGSKAAFVYKDKRGKHRAAMAPASKKTKPWMQQVAQTARSEYDGPVLTEPVSYRMVFYFQRPKSHFGTGRNAGKLKDSAPNFHTKKPDAFKLARAVEDALTGIIWRDDSQCCEIYVEKKYTMQNSRVDIEIETLI
jgi:Holliday junction resolvase RusA-like endonuclease